MRIILTLILSTFISAIILSDVAAQTRNLSDVSAQTRNDINTKTFSVSEKQELDNAVKKLAIPGHGGLEAVCSSTDNQQACACGEDACIAGATTCGCITVTPPPKN